MTNKVFSCNEWDPLEEVIVGSVLNSAKMAYEPSLAPFYPVGNEGRSFQGSKVNLDEIKRAQEQLDNLAYILSDYGITVKRPDEMDFCSNVKTPEFEVPYQNSSACPRDVLLVLGDEIIEAPMAQRARYFEYQAYRNIVKDYFKAGCKWTMAPKPTMSNLLYEKDYKPDEEFDPYLHNSLTDYEPCFDAASFVRCGKDIFYQLDTVTNEFGVKWLERHVGNEFRLHQTRFKDPHPEHLDTTLVPIKPGIVLINPERPCQNNILDLFIENNWKVLEAPASFRQPLGYTPEVSNWISMNILCLDPETVIVEEEEHEMIKFMENIGYKVITCPFSHVYTFGGSFHCCTADIRRRGKIESYFPSLDC
ncbi:hypothetical protein [Sellimonas sp.]|uniref:hypothetical protein n=1 Tax=Sellimonas sp. TaxID=2021466 RepID=UPI002580F3C8|nr:hypothetical protein [Sellimonas sp.]